MVMFVDSFHFCTKLTFGIAVAAEREVSVMETLEPSEVLNAMSSIQCLLRQSAETFY